MLEKKGEIVLLELNVVNSLSREALPPSLYRFQPPAQTASNPPILIILKSFQPAPPLRQALMRVRYAGPHHIMLEYYQDCLVPS